MKFITLFMLSILPIFLFSQNGVVQAEEVERMIDEGALFVDVREDAEIEELAYCIDNVILMPLSKIDSLYGELSKESTLILACRSGGRSARAIDFLYSKGYTSLFNLEGGIKTWQGKGYPVIVDGVKPTGKSCSKSCKSSGKSGKAKSCCSSSQKASCCSKSNKKQENK